MSPVRRFTVFRPRSIGDALACLDGETVMPRVLAGGTDLVPRIALENTATLVCLSGVESLLGVRQEGDKIVIGSMVTHQHGPVHPTLAQKLPGLAAAWQTIANPRIRARATVGGNLMARQPRFEVPVLLAALGAQLVLAEGKDVSRCSPLEVFDRNPRRECLIEIEVPVAARSAFLYDRSMRPYGSYALAIEVTRDDYQGRVAVGTDRQYPWLLRLDLERVQSATQLKASAADVAARAASMVPDSAGDIHASAGYRRQLTQVMVRRLLERASEELR